MENGNIWDQDGELGDGESGRTMKEVSCLMGPL